MKTRKKEKTYQSVDVWYTGENGSQTFSTFQWAKLSTLTAHAKGVLGRNVRCCTNIQKVHFNFDGKHVFTK